MKKAARRRPPLTSAGKAAASDIHGLQDAVTDLAELGVDGLEHGVLALADGRVRILQAVAGQRADNLAAFRDLAGLDVAQRAAQRSRRGRLAEHALGLRQQALGIENTSLFLMRVLFCMFAEDVELLPKDSFKTLLEDCARKPAIAPESIARRA